MTTHRQYDVNGWFEVPRNPISKVGVFPYLGRSIGAPEPDRVYNVLRPEEELSDPDTLASFRLAPFVDDHTMLGNDEEVGETPAEQKGVHGVLGERIEYDAATRTVYGNLKVFSKSLANRLKHGKREVSCGYRCAYEAQDGTYEGQPYQYVQRRIRGNHLALVDKGRMGPDVRVLDHLSFTVDAEDLIPMATEDAFSAAADALALAADAIAANPPPAPGGSGGVSPETLQKIVAAAQAIIQACAPGTAPQAEAEEKPEKGEETKTGDDADNMAGDGGKDSMTQDNPDKDALDALDVTNPEALKRIIQAQGRQLTAQAAELAELKGRPGYDAAELTREMGARDTLAERLKDYVGSFDHSAMTLAEVAKYGCDKLDIKGVPEGAERVALDGYFAGRPNPSQAVASHSADAAEVKQGGAVAKYLNPTDAG